ncbi:MAG: hypothetical protein M1818_004275 [Claussenomyces sp. TS43310]|nr:MAG: hypothetical protein M1818_004275 [Claussenomyces sp. TS43310]
MEGPIITWVSWDGYGFGQFLLGLSEQDASYASRMVELGQAHQFGPLSVLCHEILCMANLCPGLRASAFFVLCHGPEERILFSPATNQIYDLIDLDVRAIYVRHQILSSINHDNVFARIAYGTTTASMWLPFAPSEASEDCEDLVNDTGDQLHLVNGATEHSDDADEDFLAPLFPFRDPDLELERVLVNGADAHDEEEDDGTPSSTVVQEPTPESEVETIRGDDDADSSDEEVNLQALRRRS